MWFLSAVNGETPLRALKLKARIVSVNGYTRILMVNIGKLIPSIIVGSLEGGKLIAFIAKILIMAPIIKEPESPMKILAGEKLKIKNPNNAPDKTKLNKDKGMFSEKANSSPKEIEEMKPIPPAKPSKPSIRLYAFTITIYVKIDMI